MFARAILTVSVVWQSLAPHQGNEAGERPHYRRILELDALADIVARTLNRPPLTVAGFLDSIGFSGYVRKDSN